MSIYSVSGRVKTQRIEGRQCYLRHARGHLRGGGAWICISSRVLIITNMSGEGNDLKIVRIVEPSNEDISDKHEAIQSGEDAFEIFKREDGQVDFRTVSWIWASVIFLKGKWHAYLLPYALSNMLVMYIQ